MTSRRIRAVNVTLTLLAAVALTGCAPAERPPNVVLIFADDLGYGDVSSYGGEVPTPHIDSIGTAGVRFTDGYVTAPVCSPSRAALLTGRYQQRFGHEFNIEGHWWRPHEVEQHGLDLDERTLADVLRARGYATGLVGKWHLGMEPDYLPLERGFDEFFGILSWGYIFNPPGEPWSPPPRDLTEAEGRRHFHELLGPVYRGTEPVEVDEYFTDALTREAVEFIERHRRGPFFLYLAYTAVHVPLEATPEYLDRFPDMEPESRRIYAAMTGALDDGVGAVLAALRRHGLEENTMLFFISDNGALTLVQGDQFASNDPLKGGKLTLYEGGVRIPYLFQWPGHIPKGAVYRQPVSSLDVIPTVLAAAGISASADRPIDGVDLLPHLEGTASEAPHDVLCWRSGMSRAVRKGRWKLVQLGANPVELYDLSTDIGESNDLAAEHPEVVAELEAAYAAWQAEMTPPAWPTLRDVIRFEWQGKQVELEI
jgi:arylsulfatase A-like enzyme